MSKSKALLELKKVHKEYQSGDRKLTILEDLDLTIYEGETCAITGSSGSGKSTLLNLMAGLDKITSGEILLEQKPFHNLNEDQLAKWRREDVGFIFQDFRLISSFTALENISLPLEILGWPSQKASERANQLLKELGIENRGTHFPNQLSGGEQQRVAIGRAFAHEPKLIFADEPTGNLDPSTSEQILETLKGVHSTHKSTMILVTHDMSIAAQMQRNIALHQGKAVTVENQNQPTSMERATS